MSLAPTLRTIADEVNALYLERRGAVEATMLALLCKEHTFILGPPGTGKSGMCREIVGRFDGSTYFETILSRQRADQAVLGPYDLPLLRDKGEFKRRTEGYLPSVNFAFIDEVGKMSPTTGHDMLALLNERILHQVTHHPDGTTTSTIDVPLYSAFTASNELIAEESEEGAAVWDRLLFRTVVDNIQEPGAFQALLALDDNARSRTTVAFADLQQAIDIDVPAIKVPVSVIDVVMQLREALRAEGIVVSDRRWRQCVKILRASAYLDGRTEATDDDVHALRYALWSSPTDKTKVERLCLQVSNPLAEKLMGFSEEAEAISREIRARKGQAAKDKATYGIEANGKLKLLVLDVEKVKKAITNEGRSTVAVDEVLARIAAVKDSVMVELLDV